MMNSAFKMVIYVSQIMCSQAASSSSWSGPGAGSDGLAGLDCSGWACKALIWGPRVQFVLGGAIFLASVVAQLCEEGCSAAQEMCTYSVFMVILCCVAYWPLLMSAEDLLEMHWAVAYILNGAMF